MNLFDSLLKEKGLTLHKTKTEVLQINVGKLCNLTCVHCHVNAGPKRKEIMTRETIDRILDWLAPIEIPIIDLTGGAPEMIPDFRYLVERLKSLQPTRRIIDRCNLTILLEEGFEWLGEFLKKHEIEIIASMPCYSPQNVDAQRGQGVFDQSIVALQLLNNLGYGKDPRLPLHLAYNPVGAFLPPQQEELEAEYKIELQKHFNIIFNRLYTITNMPIARFASYLQHNGEYEKYLELLVNAFNPHAVDGVMCRNTVSVGWRGEVYDCDFNQQLGMQWQCNGNKPSQPLYLWDISPIEIKNRQIMTGEHCFGCTAGFGSSCTGIVVREHGVSEGSNQLNGATETP